MCEDCDCNMMCARVVQCSLFCPNASYFYISTPCLEKSTTPLLSTSSSKSYHHTTVLQLFFWDHPGEPVPEENFWTLCCKGRLTEADTPTIQLGATPSGLTSAHLHHPPHFLQAGLDALPAAQPTVLKH